MEGPHAIISFSEDRFNLSKQYKNSEYPDEMPYYAVFHLRLHFAKVLI